VKGLDAPCRSRNMRSRLKLAPSDERSTTANTAGFTPAIVA
jgi:hypothetical protein